MNKPWTSEYCVEGVMDFQDDFEDALQSVVPDDWQDTGGTIRITVEWVEDENS